MAIGSRSWILTNITNVFQLVWRHYHYPAIKNMGGPFNKQAHRRFKGNIMVCHPCLNW